MPFGKPVNFDEFGALLAARGPYLEWHNTIKAGSACAAGLSVCRSLRNFRLQFPDGTLKPNHKTILSRLQANSKPNPRFPKQKDNVDTIVDPSEFRQLLVKALDLLPDTL